MDTKNLADAQAPDLAAAREFLAYLRPENHLLTAIPPDGGPTVSRHFERADDPDIAGFIAHVQAKGWGCYYALNPPATDRDRKASRADIARAEWLHVDVDPPAGMGRDEGRAAIIKRIETQCLFVPEPTLVDSGNGFQCIWRLEQPTTDLDAVEGANRAIASALGGDPGTWNCDRILRLPGTTNFPSQKKIAAGRKPTPARLMKQGASTDLETLAAFFPRVPRPATKVDAYADIDFAAVFGASCLEDLPAELASRFKAACADDRTLAGLWAGIPAPGQSDTSGSGFAFALAKQLARSFDPTETAMLIYVCDATSALDKKDERYLSRAVAAGIAAAPPNAAEEFAAVDDGEIVDRRTAPAKPTGFVLIRASDMVVTEPEFLVHGLIETDSLALIFGDPGCGKSFLAIDLAACIATGTPFHGNEVRSGTVIYCAGEGHNGLRRRTAAWERARGQSLDGAPLFFSRAAARFLDAAHAKSVTEAVDAIARTEGPPRLIVVDTLARSFAGGDENATADMGEFIAAVDVLKARYPACTVLIVHHSGHADKQRARGAMALKGALDTEYRCELVEGVMTVVNSKMKDALPPAPLAFELQPVQIGIDSDGFAYTSAVLSPTFARARKATMTSGARLALDTFRAAQEGDTAAVVQIEKWRDKFYERHTGDTLSAKRQAFHRAREALVSAGHVTVKDDIYSLPHAG